MAADPLEGDWEPEVRVLVVDDQPLFLGVAEEVINATSGFRAVGCARSGEAALEWLRTREADLVVMDVRMPGCDGIVAAREVAAMDDPPVVLLCSGDERPDIAADPQAHGADAFHRKERFGARLLREVWGRHGACRSGSRAS
jgi:DNA-binding NarL/FixJ family response regulator